MTEAKTLKRKMLGVQVCVPKAWSDEKITQFANADTCCGTTLGWVIDEDQGRVTCANDSGMLHIVLVA